ncbi:nuclear transcription factor Y subunit B-1-like [Phoenix dactylifera]|uniref:Nuclear transcription factor Y subunit B-1-like n=1 Tax=Phoenix dactylifera TaxID=42345 RepID=A0A8B7CQU9_PHODC|nr:nuclear transcription factor Y subunit B-1-like [Phoenix dactylifera]
MKGRRNHRLSPVGSPPSDTESGGAVAAGHGLDSSLKEQDRFLPIANVSRIMKRSLPANAKISKEAKETVQECVSEFISFITGEASDKCQKEKRKTINGDDLLWAMTTLGFENYIEPLKVYLNRYRETEGEKNSMARQGDQSPNEEGSHNPSSYHGASGVSPMANRNTVTSNATLMGFPGGFYSAGPSAAPQGFGGGGGRMMGFGEHYKISLLSPRWKMIPKYWVSKAVGW